MCPVAKSAMRTQERQSDVAVAWNGSNQKPVALWAELGIVVKGGRAALCSLIAQREA